MSHDSKVRSATGCVLAVALMTACALFGGCRGTTVDVAVMLDYAQQILRELGNLATTQRFQEVKERLDECAMAHVAGGDGARTLACIGELFEQLSQAMIDQARESGLRTVAAERARDSARTQWKDREHNKGFGSYKLVAHLIRESLVAPRALVIWDFEAAADYPHCRGVLNSSLKTSILKDESTCSKVLLMEYPASRDFDYVTIGLKGLNLSGYRYLMFAMRGDEAVGFFKVELKTAGQTWNIPSVYVHDRLDGSWQWVAVPLESFTPRVPTGPDELVFVFEKWKGARKGRILIDSICLAKDVITLQALGGTAELQPKFDLEEIQRRAVMYFWEQANPTNGLVKDRSTPDSPCSIAAVGFGLTAIVIGVERGWIDRDAGFRRILTTLRFLRDRAETERGFFYHFLDMSTGERFRWPDGQPSELSSIDTALLIAGVLFAGQYFRGSDLATLAQELYQRVDWQWMLNGGETLCMCWTPEHDFCEARWADYSEHMIMYLLAIGSPTHPIPPECWHAWKRPVADRYGLKYIHNVFESLFVYQYSHAYVDFRGKHDAYADYWQNSVNAIKANREFVLQHMDQYPTYAPNIWGITASDGPEGYKNYGAAPGNHDGTIAPYGMIASLPFVPELAQMGIDAMTARYGTRLWGRYGFTSAFNKGKDWYSNQYIGIDMGIIALMVENHRSAFVWKTFMQHEAIREAMQRVGFVQNEIDGSLTPWYREQLDG